MRLSLPTSHTVGGICLASFGELDILDEFGAIENATGNPRHGNETVFFLMFSMSVPLTLLSSDRERTTVSHVGNVPKHGATLVLGW
jgi:hypothetical protein